MSPMSNAHRSLSNSFEANIQNLFEELHLSIQWQRPSILVVIHRSAWGQKKAAARLQNILARLDCAVVELHTSSEQASIAHQISTQANTNKTVYFIFNLDHGGDDEHIAYRALNMYREFFIDNKIKAVFWLTHKEAINLPLHAPDFWAFRHRVIEFEGRRSKSIPIPWHNLAIWYKVPGNEISSNEKIPLLEKAMEEMSLNPDTLSMRVQLMYEIGYAHWKSGRLEKSYDAVKRGLELLTGNTIPYEHLRFLNAMALFHIHEGHNNVADEILGDLSRRYNRESIPRLNLGISLCAQGKNYKGVSQGKKAIRLEPSNPEIWNGLGYLYISAGKLNDALTCFEHAIRLAPDEKRHHEAIATCYYLLGWTEKALSVFETLYYTDRQSNILVDIYRQRIMGGPEIASRMLHIEIANGTISQMSISENPNFYLILDSGLSPRNSWVQYEN